MSLRKNADKVTLRAVSDLLIHGALLFPFGYGIRLVKRSVCLSCRTPHVFHFCPSISAVTEHVPLTSTPANYQLSLVTYRIQVLYKGVS